MDNKSLASIACLLSLVASGCRCGPARSTHPAGKPVVVFSPGKQEVELLMGGDTTLARHVAKAIATHGKGDPGYSLALVQDVLRSADLSILNLECVLASSSEGKLHREFNIRADPGLLSALTIAGVDLVTISNNHALDYANPGIVSTLSNLRREGILVMPVLERHAVPQEPLYLQVGNTKFAFLAYNAIVYPGDETILPRPAPYELENVLRDIRRARPHSDQVVVSVHWGVDYSMTPTSKQVADAHTMVEAGADLVYGHHPHVPQEVEEHRGGLIAYSMGNFLFGLLSPYKKVRTRRGFLLKVRFRGGKRISFGLVPIRLDRRLRPRVDPTIDVDSWICKPNATPYDFLEHLEDASVSRVHDQESRPCDLWSTRAPRRRHRYQRWLAPRWRCARDKSSPHLTVAATGERSGTVFRRGIWAHPHRGGPLLLRFPDVPLGHALVGHAGIPDYSLKLGRGEPPVRLRISLVGVDAAALDQEIPFEPGWVPLRLDTSALAGQTGEVVVEVGGAASGKESGFVFNLWVEAAER